MPYIPHTEAETDEMLKTIGVDSIEQLFDEIPNELRCKDLADVPVGMSEFEITRLMEQRANQDGVAHCFIGAGAYDHHIPASVWELAMRGEFYSAYTPYQAEASQGTLQMLYEYQSMMTQLTAMDVSNASLYDGGSALAEAVLMAIRANRKSKSKTVLMPRNVHPHYRDTVNNIVVNQGIQCSEVQFNTTTGLIDTEQLDLHDQDNAALIISQPNFFGQLEEVDALTDWAHHKNMLVIAVVNPISLALLKPPGEWGETGADIVCGEGQPLGIPLSSGGPYFGFMCCKKAIVRQMPGRIIGQTVDTEGMPGYTLTLQAREQHIRRSKATSNICTNQGLMVTAATIYLAIMGAAGLQKTALACHHNTQDLMTKMIALPGIERVYTGACFHEVVVRFSGELKGIIRAMHAQNILPGYLLEQTYPELENCLLVCVTETKQSEDIDFYISNLSRILERQSTGQCPIQPKL